MTNVSRSASRAFLPVFAAACTLLLNPTLRPVEAQGSRSRVQPRVEPIPDIRIRQPQIIDLGGPPGVFNRVVVDPSRAVIGLTMSSGGRSDTLGVLVAEISKGGPAEKAGLKEGERITAINGVNLRVSGSDADDEELRGIGQRRLQREMAKVKAGDEVELRVTEAGAAKTLKLKAVAEGDLPTEQSMRAPLLRDDITSSIRSNDNRATLGVIIGNSGNLRDTLGLFVSSVTNKGPAETAGVIEGDRIASINGVDVRVPKEDAEDGAASSARMNRFTRELGKAAAGDKIALKVYSAGRYRDVTVTAGKGSDLMGGMLRINGDGMLRINGDGMLRMNGDGMQLNGGTFRMEGGTIQLPRIMSLPRGNTRVLLRRSNVQ